MLTYEKLISPIGRELGKVAYCSLGRWRINNGQPTKIPNWEEASRQDQDMWVMVAWAVVDSLNLDQKGGDR